MNEPDPRWKQGAPRAPGWYWWWRRRGGIIAVEVLRHGGDLFAHTPDSSHPWPVASLAGQWIGPFEVPEPPAAA